MSRKLRRAIASTASIFITFMATIFSIYFWIQAYIGAVPGREICAKYGNPPECLDAIHQMEMSFIPALICSLWVLAKTIKPQIRRTT